MEIKIDKDGILWIKRGKKFKAQRCRHDGIFCGDACPLFGEPEWTGDNPTLDICNKILTGTIIDERVVMNNSGEHIW